MSHDPSRLDPELLPAGAERLAGPIFCGPGGLLEEVDFAGLGETQSEKLFAAWLRLCGPPRTTYQSGCLTLPVDSPAPARASTQAPKSDLLVHIIVRSVGIVP